MSDEISPAGSGTGGQTPGQGEGQLQTQAGATQSGAPAEGSTQQGSQTEQAPQFLTRAEAEEMLKEVENRARSYADKGRIRAEEAAQKAQEMVKELRSYGKEISEEEANQIVAAAKQKAIMEPGADDETETVPPAQAEQELQYIAQNNLGAHDLKMQGKYGIELTADDPEVKAFKITGNPQTDAANIEKMYQAKQARMTANPGEQLSQIIPTNPALRVPNGSGSAPSKYDLNQPASTFLEMAASEKK